MLLASYVWKTLGRVQVESLGAGPALLKELDWTNFPSPRQQCTLRGLGTTHLDLGCGLAPKNPFCCDYVTGLDVIPEELVLDRFAGATGFDYVHSNLLSGLPFPDDTFSSVSAFDVVEHVPRYHVDESGQVSNPFISLMNEVYRILTPGGVFLAVTPAYPSGAAFQDPTHVNFITKRTIGYFAGEQAFARELGYGFTGRYRLLHQGWMRNEYLRKLSVPTAPTDLPNTGSAQPPRVERDLKLALGRAKGRLELLVRPTHLIWLLQAV